MYIALQYESLLGMFIEIRSKKIKKCNFAFSEVQRVRYKVKMGQPTNIVMIAGAAEGTLLKVNMTDTTCPHNSLTH
jgi:hypothetical protein